jgi:hypothetical protein
MKRIFFSITLITLAISCKKVSEQKIVENKDSITELTQKISESKNFTEFTRTFIVNMAKIGRINSPKYENRLLNENDSINYEKTMIFKNRIDNQTIELLVENPALVDMDSLVVENIIKNAIDAKLAMNDVQTIAMIAEINMDLNNIMISTINKNATEGTPKLTLDEVWDCAKQALGVGSGSILTIAGIQKLVKEGIQQVVLTVSKFLAKNAGWFGAAIMVIDFSSCIYAEYND